MAQWILGQRVLYSISFWHIVTPKKLLNESWMKKMEHLALKTLDGSNYQKSIMSMKQQQLPLVAFTEQFIFSPLLHSFVVLQFHMMNEVQMFKQQVQINHWFMSGISKKQY